MVFVGQVLVVVAITTLLSVALVLLARVTWGRHRMRGTQDVETAYITAVSTLYGIFIAFMIFTVWTRYNEAREATSAEADTVAEIYRTAGGLPEPMRGSLQKLMIEYGHSVVDHEWGAMLHGLPSRRTEAVVRKIWAQFDTMPDQVRDSVLRDHLLTSWTRMTDLRRERLLRASTGLSEYAYALLIIGALINLGLACVFTVDDIGTHVLKAAALGTMIGVMLVAIWGLDHPFRSRVRIAPAAFVHVLEMLEGRGKYAYFEKSKSASETLPTATSSCEVLVLPSYEHVTVYLPGSRSMNA